MMESLETRRLRPERLDDPGLDAGRHAQALRGLERINLLSASARLLWPSLRGLLRRRGPLRVLDLATGAGDVPVALARRARRERLPLEIHGCDASPRALDHARALAARRRVAIHLFPRNILNGPLPPDYDVYLCSLFLHHLREEQAIELLRKMSAADALLVNDLARCRPGMMIARTIPHLLTRSAVVHEDSVLSVGNAFTMPEVRTLAQRAGLEGASVRWRWPFRFLLEWNRP